MKMLQEEQKQEKPVSDLPFTLFPNQTVETVVKKRNKVFLVSNHCHNYDTNSKVSWNLLKILSTRVELEVTHFGLQPNPLATADHRKYPDSVKYFALKTVAELSEFVEKEKPEFLIFYNQIEVIAKFRKGLDACSYKGFKTVFYVDFVYHNINDNDVDFLNAYADRVFVNSEFYKSMLLSSRLVKPVDLLRYGIDSELKRFERNSARAKINLPESGFTILAPWDNNVNNRYDIIIKAFAKLVTKYPSIEIRLLCLCDKSDLNGYPIIDIYKREIINNNHLIENHSTKIMLIQNSQVFNDIVKNAIFCSINTSICCAQTANIELNALEMLYLGIPVIIPDAGGHKEYFNDSNSTPVKIHSHSYLSNNGDGAGCCDVKSVDYENVFLALENYLTQPNILGKHGEVATQFNSDWAKNSTGLLEYITQR